MKRIALITLLAALSNVEAVTVKVKANASFGFGNMLKKVVADVVPAAAASPDLV